MSKFVVVVFPSETQAYQGTRALQDLDMEGSVTLYGMAVIAKDASGKVAIKQAADQGPLGTALGALVGSLVGVIGGPAGVAIGLAGGTVIGSLMDLFNFGVGDDFLAKVSKDLGPGKSAVVAEIAEDWTTPLDTRMESLGGTVLRTWRADFEDDQLAKEAAACQADVAELRAEYAKARAEAKAKVKAKLDQANAAFEASQRKLQAKIDALDKENKAKIDALTKQLAAAKADAKDKITKRIEAVRADYAVRSGKLKQAWQLTKEALAA